MGLGLPIDFEPPVITLDPGPNPRYVRLGTKITGTVTDNVGVETLIMRDAATGELLFPGRLLPNDRFEFVLDFTQDDDGEKFSVEIVAHDRIGNAGIANLTIIVDLSPPVVESAWIERFAGNISWLEPYAELKALETQDPNAEKSEHMHRYQNGWFTLSAKLTENETRIEDIIVNIYDSRYEDEVLLPLDRETNTSLYSPKWLIKEDVLIAEGVKKWGQQYHDNYYNSGERYYYFITITAFDRSENDGTLRERVQVLDQDGVYAEYFCMWEKADIPKGIIDPVIGSVIYKKMPVPVQFFDDDALTYAYAGLLTDKQWSGESDIFAGEIKIAGSNDTEKLEFLRKRLVDDGLEVYNWKYDERYPHYSNAPGAINDTYKVREYVGSRQNANDLLVHISTGEHDNDYGEYVLFTLVMDKKLPPHPAVPINQETFKPRFVGKAVKVNIIDDNMPLIVFDTVDTSTVNYAGCTPGNHTCGHLGHDLKEDGIKFTTGNSPEENTFPRLNIDGETFSINGFTLRENNSGQNRVQRFRIAWIPNGILDPATERTTIRQVEQALRYHLDPFEPIEQTKTENQFPAGVQYWIMDDADFANTHSYSIDGPGLLHGTDQILSSEKGGIVTSTTYIKQVFRKEFNILGGEDNLKPEYKNFTYNDVRENETKVFVLCAIDNMGKVVFRTIRLLSNKTPPDLVIYDITGKPMTLPNNVMGMPNNTVEVGNPPVRTIPSPYFYSAEGEITNNYRTARSVFNDAAYSTLRSVSFSDNILPALPELKLSDEDKTVSFQSYPRGTQLKYWVVAEKSGDLAIESITMEDVTFKVEEGQSYDKLGHLNAEDRALGYVELFPEISRRVFLFTAVDSLGNKAEIQRTVAITSAAMLTNITTSTQDGTYGIGTKITLQANFDGQISVNGNASDILLNIRYAKTGIDNPLTEDDFVFKQIPCTKVNPLSLEFEYTVLENDFGLLETMYDTPAMFFSKEEYNKPITLKNGVEILDGSRAAFTPGNVLGFTWTSNRNSLQDPENGKSIRFNGTRPSITSLVVSGKTPFAEGANTNYYFRGGETITFTLTADRDIRTTDVLPRIQFQIENDPLSRTLSELIYQRPDGTNKMIFSLDVNRTNLPVDGRLISFSLSTAGGNIVDDYGNPVIESTVNIGSFNTMLENNRIFNDQTPPERPGTTLTPNHGTVGATPNDIWYYTTGPYLFINEDTNEQYGQTRQYSLDGGITWRDFPLAETELEWTETITGNLYIRNSKNNTPWSLQTRIVDRAGNESETTNQLVHVSAAFPSITSVTVNEQDGTYTSGSLSFALNFDDPVRVNGTVSITLTNRHNSNNNNPNGGTNPSYQMVLNAAAGQNVNYTTTIRFDWPSVAGKEMHNGLYISNINITGLQDRFGNVGGNGSASSSGAGLASTIAITTATADPTANYTVNNLTGGIIVDSLAPAAPTFVPVSDGVLDGTRRTITLTFNEDMMRGSGTITVRPRTGYLIPPVFENAGYYLGTDGERYATPQNGPTVYTTYVDGFYDIYNNAELVAADRQALTQSVNATNPSMGNLVTNVRTGQSVGPYQRLTQGLRIGNGYTGNYNDVVNGPNPQANESTGVNNRFLVPDTDTKWVLNYQLRINDTANAQITAIRNVLTKAKFRWQEIDVINTTVDGRVVTITLNEPLLEGLQWELFYPAGAFADIAGNPAPAVTEASPHYFWSSGIQTPVIRVNRRSYDARAVGTPLANLSDQSTRGAYPTPPGTTTNWNTAGFTVTDITGWGIADFNTIHYRIESETPGATIESGIYGNDTAARRTNRGSVTAAYSGNVYEVNPVNRVTDFAWNSQTLTNGTWVLTNLIRRAGTGAGANRMSYTILENGNTVTRASRGNYYGLRSYNKDATIANLNGVGLTPFGSAVNQGIITFGELEAGKGYIVAQASRPGYTDPNPNPRRGYEGVFRTVIALYNTGTTANVGANRPVIVEGSNIKNGMPSIAGFPVRDAEEVGDNRYIKMFHRRAADNAELLWVSTEIVCEWFFIKFGGRQNGSTHMQDGEVENYLTVGYGDLTYGYNIRSYND